ncbi:hypothetical protein ACFSHT_22360 [Paraburkholderia silviterrae]|uniref:Uncharacterized protein n=1 Tax=Paraburkholderia silviterrae TaxID=2528715 RepID=A0A4R5MF50_9BURK|nr:hypothetical protein [Paraburkholderia silviterrae]TDG25875.1 hypothetical protein EYW47_00445 [Paraburkholderia silviterrae]
MAKKGGGLIHDAGKGSMGGAKGSSMSQNTSVGSGARPTRSRIPIETSSPRDQCGLDGRKTKGALK